MITIDELQTFTKLNAPARVIECYIALRSFMWNGRSAFPSLKKIAERMGLENKTFKQTVSVALKWLEDHGMIKRNSRTSKERFVLTTPNEKLVVSHSKFEKKLVSKPIEKEPITNKSITPINPRGDRQRNRRFSPHEKRHRKWLRKVEANEREQARREQQANESKNETISQWRQEHLEAQESLIPLHGTKKHSEKMALLLARFNFERFPELWNYEPATIQEIGLQRDLTALELHHGRFKDVPFVTPFTFGVSIQQIKKWFMQKEG